MIAGRQVVYRAYTRAGEKAMAFFSLSIPNPLIVCMHAWTILGELPMLFLQQRVSGETGQADQTASCEVFGFRFAGGAGRSAGAGSGACA